MWSDSLVGIPTGGTIVRAVPPNVQVEIGPPGAQGRLVALLTTVGNTLPYDTL